MRILSILLPFFLPLCAFAYGSVIAEFQSQTVIVPIENPNDAQEFFGHLLGFPQTFYFEVKQSLPFKAEVFVGDVPSQKNDVSIIIVKQEKRGVSEVGRTLVTTQSWKPVYDRMLVESFRNGGALNADLQPGKYKLEVSSPNNEGIYRLVLGTDKIHRGYFANVQALFAVKSLFGHSKFGTLLSPLLYIPLLVLSIIGGLFFIHKKRRGEKL
jgi:hypothetical protein